MSISAVADKTTSLPTQDKAFLSTLTDVADLDLSSLAVSPDPADDKQKDSVSAPTIKKSTISNTHGFSSGVVSAIVTAATKYKIEPQLMLDFAQIESSGRPGASNGKYGGLFALDISKYGRGTFNASTNANAAASELSSKIRDFVKTNGRQPNATELYLLHQQGAAGGPAHMGNLDGIAWKNISRFYKNDGIAKSAIWKNIPADMKHLFPGGVNTVTSAEFYAVWKSKLEKIPYDTALAFYKTPDADTTKFANAISGDRKDKPATIFANVDIDITSDAEIPVRESTLSVSSDITQRTVDTVSATPEADIAEAVTKQPEQSFQGKDDWLTNFNW